MPLAPVASNTQVQATSSAKFTVDKDKVGGISVLSFQGTLDHAFEGRKLGESVHTKKLVVNLRGVRRFSSWGMTEWMDFLRCNAERDLYLVECSAYAASQLNLVTGMLGHAKLVSFYAPCRCTSCNEEFETLFLTPSDRDALISRTYEEECRNCGGRVRLEENSTAFFEAIVQRAAFDVDDEVLAFLRQRYKYDITADETRLRAYRRVTKDHTYLRLSGNIAALPAELLANACHGTTVVDVGRIIYDPHQLAAWQSFVQMALARVTSLQLLDCPVGFLEIVAHPEQLKDRMKIRTFALQYQCATCLTTTARIVDVAEHLEQLVAGIAPPARCPGCQATVPATLTPIQILTLRGLPARDRDTNLEKFLAKMRGESIDNLEDCLIPHRKEVEAPVRAPRGMFLILGASLLVIAGLVTTVLILSRQQTVEVPVVAVQQPLPPPPPTFVRPDWIMSDLPSSAYCSDLINRLMCVGVSAYRPTRDEAVAEANDAALEELANAIGLKISDRYFKDTVMARYGSARAKVLQALQAVDLDRASAAYATAADQTAKARRRVVEILQASGGAAVPTRRTDWYWEEYAKKGGGTETLVFVRYDVPLAAVRALVEKYSTVSPVGHSFAMTAFPSLAWDATDFTGGALVTKVGSPLSEAGIAANDIVMAAGDDRIEDAAGLAKVLDDWKGTAPLQLTVKTADTPAKTVAIKHR